MERSVFLIVGVICMISLIIGVDIAFYRTRPVRRLLVNVAIVAVSAALYFLLRDHL